MKAISIAEPLVTHVVANHRTTAHSYD